MQVDPKWRYIQSEMLAVCPLPVDGKERNGDLRLRIRSERGETKWLTISEKQFKMIEEVLFDVEVK